VNYWVVIRGFQLFFYKNPDTHINENVSTKFTLNKSYVIIFKSKWADVFVINL